MLEVIVDLIGYVRVEEFVVFDNYFVVNVVLFFFDKVDVFLVFDKNGEFLFYNVNGFIFEIMGSVIVVNIIYYIVFIILKLGEVWIVVFSLDVLVKIVFFEGVIIVDLSEILVEIMDEYLVMFLGNISVFYILFFLIEIEMLILIFI